MSCVLLWQPSDCVHSMVMIVLCCSWKINMIMMMRTAYVTNLLTKLLTFYLFLTVFCCAISSVFRLLVFDILHYGIVSGVIFIGLN